MACPNLISPALLGCNIFIRPPRFEKSGLNSPLRVARRLFNELLVVPLRKKTQNGTVMKFSTERWYRCGRERESQPNEVLTVRHILPFRRNGQHSYW